MKVAYLVSLFPKISETFILREMQSLRERGVEVAVVSLKSRREPLAHPGAREFEADTIYADGAGPAAAAFVSSLATRPLASGGALARVTAGSLATAPAELVKSLPLVAVAARVGRLLRARGIDRVHAHWATYPALVAWAVRRLEGIPYSLTAHAHDIFAPNPLLRRKILESDFTVTISESNRRHLERACGAEAARRLRVVHCGVPLGEYPVREALPAGPVRVISVGRLVDYKGFPTLLRAIATLRDRGRDVTCEIIGDGPLEATLRLLIREFTLTDRVELTGSRPMDEVRRTISAASVCALACERGRGGLMDGIPVVLMEAMALGVPVVSTRLSGIPELVEDGRTGLLVEPGDARALADALDAITTDLPLAARLAGAARRHVEDHFDIAKSADALLALMRSPPAGAAR
ncbi:MAG: glycosyltransferase [Acidobacteria bacterium]|nr:glycosyltransferase [Acidobacteriota bacterium]